MGIDKEVALEYAKEIENLYIENNLNFHSLVEHIKKQINL